MPWDLSGACNQLPNPTACAPLHPSPVSSFKMHKLLASLPDPMLLESTLPMPSAMAQPTQIQQPPPPQCRYSFTTTANATTTTWAGWRSLASRGSFPCL
jgi:hypothetical protein